jgi:hypothetical protein
MKRNSSFNAQGSRLIILHVYVEIVKNIWAEKSNRRLMVGRITGETQRESQKMFNL